MAKKKEEFIPKRVERRPTFSDKNEEELRKSLFEKVEEDEEESPTYEPIEDWHKKRTNGLWDVILEDELKYFDPELSYELTGYRPITETEGLDFDPAPFREAGQTFERTGQYTAYPKGSKPLTCMQPSSCSRLLRRWEESLQERRMQTEERCS